MDSASALNDSALLVVAVVTFTWGVFDGLADCFPLGLPESEALPITSLPSLRRFHVPYSSY
jgi:hypothetical protein